MKKNIFILVFIICASIITAYAQSWQWASQAGGLENDYANAIDVDDFGNTYVTGKFYDSISFGLTTLINSGTWSVYIAKYEASGNLVWAKIAATDSAISVSGISVDKFGGISITGQYFATASFGTFPTSNLTSSAGYDIFVARYNADGDLILAKSLGGQGIDYSGGVASDKMGNIFLTGDFHISSFPYSGSKIFIAKYDSAGNSIWSKVSLNYGTDHFGNCIKVDSAGNSYITGEFFNALVFDSSVVINAGNVESNSFIAKFDSSGNILWGQKAGAGSGYCGSKALDIDNTGNSYITGYYHGTISFGSLSITSTSGIANEVYIAKCNSAGNFVWVNKSIGAGSAKSISNDQNGNVFISGTFAQVITFGIISLTSVGNGDIFIAAINPSGNYVWADACGGPDIDNNGGLKVNSAGIYLAGYFTSTIQFGSSLSLTDNSSIKSDIFLTKLSNSTGIQEKENYSNGISCFPNPADNEFLLKGNRANEKYIVYDILGHVMLHGMLNGTNKIATRNLEEGIYFIRLSSEHTALSKEIIICH